MINCVRVAWSVYGSEAPFDLIVGDIETELPSWVECDDSALAAVNTISARYFGDRVWESRFGLDLTEAEVLFQITAPATLAGSYEVALRRVTTAECRKVSDPRLDHACTLQDQPVQEGRILLVSHKERV